MVALTDREQGFTLLELIFAVAAAGLLALVFAVPLLDPDPQRAASAAAQVNAQLTLAQELASDNAVPSGGATVQFEPAARGTAAYVLLNRPIRPVRGAVGAPAAADRLPALVVPAVVTLKVAGGSVAGPPFAVFISPSGHRSGAAGDWRPGSSPVSAFPAAEPPCAIELEVRSGRSEEAIPLGCSAG
jgi:prepilin-type N-terminal cleavage/methylation domain-containing protein